MIPLPCNPDQISIGYGLRQGNEVTPITRLLPRELILNGPNTISYEAYPELKAKILDLLSLATAQANTEEKLAGLLCCLPQAMVPQELSYANSFRVVILQFLDRYNFDIAHGEAQLRPLRNRGWADHSVRHVQHLLSRGRGRRRRACAASGFGVSGH